MHRFLASMLLLGFASLPAYSYYPCGCPCVPAYNAVDFSAIDFSTGNPMCLSPFFAPYTLGGCTPQDLYYAFNMGPYQPQFNQFGVFTYPIPRPCLGGNCCCCVAPCALQFTPQVPVAAPAAVRPLAPAPLAPTLHGPKAGPPVIDAVDPFTVGAKDNFGRTEVAAPGTVEHKHEFDLPRVSPISNDPVESKDALEMMPPLPPEPSANQGTGASVPTPPAPNSIILPSPRFVPTRGNV